MPTVSVLIPIYNNASTLRRCLDSVFSQTLGDLEVICVDDGSTDGSGALLDEYAAAHSNMSVVHQTNHGEAASRNRAIEMAQGEFVAHMDGDDRYYDEHALQVLYEAAKANHVKVAGGKIYSYDGHTTEPMRYDCHEERITQPGVFSYADFPVISGHTRFIYLRELLTRNNVRYPDYICGCDTVFLSRALATAEQFYLTLTPVYLYTFDAIIKRSWLTPKGLLGFWGAWLDLLDIAREVGLPKLRDTVLRAMVVASTSYRLMVWRHILRGNEEMAALWLRIVRTLKSYGLHDQDACTEDIDAMRTEFNRYLTVLEQLSKVPSAVIYGAGEIGHRIAPFLRRLMGESLRGFCVSAQQPHAPAVLGLPVRTVDELPRDTLVIVGVGRQYAPEVRANLQRLGFNHVLEFAHMSISFLEACCHYPEILSGLIDEEGVQCPR